LTAAVLLLAAVSGVTACATSGRHVSAWGEITLAPGDTGVCHSSPCRVFFRMPDGEGSYRVRGQAVDIGEYPAGKTVSLGSYFESDVIKLPGAGVPPAYIYVPSTSGNDVQ
jgi:hypothetical protein